MIRRVLLLDACTLPSKMLGSQDFSFVMFHGIPSLDSFNNLLLFCLPQFDFFPGFEAARFERHIARRNMSYKVLVSSTMKVQD